MWHEALHHHPISPSDPVEVRVVTGGVLGGLPGLLLIGVPALLAELDLITADQSQIGFLGVPLMILGILVGLMLGAGGDRSLPVVVGAGSGLVLGLTVGGVLAANWVVPGLWLVLVPVGMIAGAVVAVRRYSRSPGG